MIGEPAAAIFEAATADATDLIVMGTQGLGGFRKWLLGSTTERLLRRTHLPVLAVPLAGESGANAWTIDSHCSGLASPRECPTERSALTTPHGGAHVPQQSLL